MSNINLLLFGDQTVEKLSSIRSLVRNSKTSPGARQFLQQATDVVQLEFAALNKEEHGWTHGFDSLLGLAEENAKQVESNGMIATVLMCIGRLGELIVHAEEDPSILGSKTSPTEVLALCTGLLPAATAAAARDTSELLKFGVAIISITFRMAYEISRRMRLVEDAGGNWATTVVGMPADKAKSILDDFHNTQKVPEPRRLAIGVVARGWLTLIGPPSSLTRLWRWSPEFDSAAKIQTDTNGPIHTSHMPKIDVEKVLGTSPLLDVLISSKVNITSNSSKSSYSHQTLRSLLGEMVTDIAHNVLNLDDTLVQCVAGLAGKGDVKLTVVGPTGHQPTVERALQEKGLSFRISKHIDEVSSKVRGGSDLVAIVGMAGRFPGSKTIDDFWESLLAGDCHIQKVPKSRFDLDVFYDATGKKKNSTVAQHGHFLDEPGLFDNRLFNISPREAAQMDPIQRLLLTTSYEALEMAGYAPNASLSTESNRIATYFGQASDDWHEVLNNQGVDIYYVPSLARAFGPSRLNYQYKWGGGSFALDSACATSTTAISLACSALIARECDTALTGGGSILVSPNSFSGLSRSGMISITGGCRTFHDDADGYARGEGVGVVLLKRLEDAVGDNDNILGVIRGSSRTYNATATSITHPDAKSQQRIYEDVLRQTCVLPDDIAYVEMHGTGTQAGDAAEMTSVLQTVGQNRTRNNPLVVGAVKANVGHGEAAAGVTSLIKVLMMMRERKIPPQPGLPFVVNHNFPPLADINVHIAGKDMVLKPRPGGDGKIKVLLNSFDASGGNTSLVIEEATTKWSKKEDVRTHQIVTISGRSAISLRNNTERLLDYLVRHPDTKLADLAYTTTARKMHQTVRKAHTAGSTSEMIRLIRAELQKDAVKEPPRRSGNSTRVFAFTGQGGQYAGMGRDLFLQSESFRAVLGTYQDMAHSQGLPHFIDLISDNQLDLASRSPVCVHLAIVALEIAIASMLKAWGIVPDLVIGHSLGEYAALCVSGVLSVSDTLHLVGQRAILIERKLTANSFAMVAARKNVSDLQHYLSEVGSGSCEVACLNGPNLTVVSGTQNDIADLQDRLAGEGSKTTLLEVPYGFHSKQIEPILKDFEEIAKGVVFLAPAIPVASTLTGTVVTKTSTFSPSYLTRQAREPVNFIGALSEAKKAGLANERTSWIEVGPEPICCGLIRQTIEVGPESLLPVMKKSENNWKTLSSCLATTYQSGAILNWHVYHKDFIDSLSLLDLPTYAFDEKNYWTPYVEPERVNAIADSEKAIAPPTHPHVPGFPSTSLQRIETCEEISQNLDITFASNTSEPDLFTAIQGHVVDGITVCPLSVFCDMALSAASYIHLKSQPGNTVPRMSIHDIELIHPLIVPEPDPMQIAKVTATYPAGGRAVAIKFHSAHGKSTQEHGTCEIRFGDGQGWKSDVNQTLFLLKKRIVSLQELAMAGKAHRLLKPVVYKLFANLVAYGKDYKALDEVVLDSECQDAVGSVTLPVTLGTDKFLYNPYWMDATVHLAGFLLNGSLKYSEDVACLSTGFHSWRTFEDLSPNKTYTSYVSMQETGQHDMLTGDCFVFDGDTLILATMGIKFQKLPRVVLNSILGGARSTSKPTAKTQEGQAKPNLHPTKPVHSSRSVKTSELASTKPKQVTSGRSQSPNSSSESSEERNISTPMTPFADASTEVINSVLALIATEGGYDVNDINDEMVFSDMGLDSLMSITIIANLRKDIGIELPGTFFVDHPTVGEAKAALGVETDIDDTHMAGLESTTDALIASKPSEPLQEEKPDDKAESEQERKAVTESTVPLFSPPIEEGPTSGIVLLQGLDSENTRKLFLLPDGNGSPAGYVQLPGLGADLCVLGLESPYVKDPTNHSCSYDDMVNAFHRAVKKKQPTGPYKLGGFAFGALYAYGVARKLLEVGEQVEDLILIDMAVPKPAKIDSTEILTQLEMCGIIPAVKRQTPVQKEHWKRTVATFFQRNLLPLDVDRQPIKTVLVVAISQKEQDKLASAKINDWLGGDAITRGWEGLVGNLEQKQVDADHLALLRYPTVNVLGEMLKDAVSGKTTEVLR